MVYKIDGNYFIKVGAYFVGVEATVKNGNLDLKPTDNKIEINKVSSKEAITVDKLKEELTTKPINEEIESVEEVEATTDEIEVIEEKPQTRIYEKRSFKYNK